MPENRINKGFDGICATNSIKNKPYFGIIGEILLNKGFLAFLVLIFWIKRYALAQQSYKFERMA